MKTIALFLIYIFTFMFFYFLLSTIGLLWNDTYEQCIRSGAWFGVYSLFIGSWLAFFPAREYYLYYEEYLGQVF
jgi:hypothetical protein